MKSNLNIGVIVQARLGSTRLPRKILLPFYEEKCMLDVLLNTLHRLNNVKVIVATTINMENDELVTYLEQRGELVFRGSESDVLDRFIQAADKNNINGIIRVCSDSPFMDIEGLQVLIETAYNNPSADYIGYKINDMPSIKTHFGFWGEFVTLDALKRVSSIEDGSAHEHVTIYVYSHPELFNCVWIKSPYFLEGRDDIRLTVDTLQDLNNAKEVYLNCMQLDNCFSLRDVINYVDSHNYLISSMKQIIENNKK